VRAAAKSSCVLVRSARQTIPKFAVTVAVGAAQPASIDMDRDCTSARSAVVRYAGVRVDQMGRSQAEDMDKTTHRYPNPNTSSVRTFFVRFVGVEIIFYIHLPHR
jgi:hypothetical protein